MLKKPKIIIPLSTLAISVIVFFLIVLLTNPLSNISYTLLAFLMMLVGLISIGLLIITFLRGSVSKQARSNTVILSIVLVFLVMFKSSGSLSFVDLLLTLLLGFGLLFYSSRRNA